jgi:hypothetical protein
LAARYSPGGSFNAIEPLLMGIDLTYTSGAQFAGLVIVDWTDMLVAFLCNIGLLRGKGCSSKTTKCDCINA